MKNRDSPKDSYVAKPPVKPRNQVRGEDKCKSIVSTCGTLIGKDGEDAEIELAPTQSISLLSEEERDDDEECSDDNPREKIVEILTEVDLLGTFAAAGVCRLMRKIRLAARSWGKSSFDKKIVLITDHLHATGIKTGSGSTEYKGIDAVVVELLELAIENGADIEYDHGTVSLSATGFACGNEDGYYRDHDSAPTHHKRLSVYLPNWGVVDISHEWEELIPKNYFEDEEPKDVVFEPTGKNGVQAARWYAYAEAIVVWPRSQRWRIIMMNDDTSRMCDYLLEACAVGTSAAESRAECIKKAEVLIPRVSHDGYWCRHETNTEILMKCLVRIGDQALAKKFLISYLKTNPLITSDVILQELLAFIDFFGSDTIRSVLDRLINRSRLLARPTITAKFFLNFYEFFGDDATTVGISNDLVLAFVDALCPSVPAKAASRRTKLANKENTAPKEKTTTDMKGTETTKSSAQKKSASEKTTQAKKKEKKRRVLGTGVESFPLKEILAIVATGSQSNSGVLAKRVLKGYVWLACRHYRRSGSIMKPKGPVLLTASSVMQRLVYICESFGWNEYEGVLLSITKKLCLHRMTDRAVELVERVSLPRSSSMDYATSDRGRISTRVALIVCENLAVTASSVSSMSPNERTLANYKTLAKHSRSHFPRASELFVDSAKGLDVDEILYPLVTDEDLVWSVTNAMKRRLFELADHCTQVLMERIENQSKRVLTWTLPNANTSSNFHEFLNCPCQQIEDWQVHKSDHKAFLQDMAFLIDSSKVKAESYQPGGQGSPYHFKITKLVPQMVPLTSVGTMTCSCSSSMKQSCLLGQYKKLLVGYKEDKKRLAILEKRLTAIEAYLNSFDQS